MLIDTTEAHNDNYTRLKDFVEHPDGDVVGALQGHLEDQKALIEVLQKVLSDGLIDFEPYEIAQAYMCLSDLRPAILDILRTHREAKSCNN